MSVFVAAFLATDFAVPLAGDEVPTSTDRRTEENGVAFNRDIRPILSDNCFTCHGPDKNQRKAQLRLDTREGFSGDRKGGPIIVPGDPDRSELFRRITTSDSDDRMPPAKVGKTLSARQVDLIRAWILQGAEWEGHWAYIPPTRPALPAVDPDTDSWAVNEIDRFIGARRAIRGLKPSPEADRRTLIRRLSFDLTGLPPDPEAVEAFTSDRREEAHESLVDQMLASPHYGERMAIYWLDLVRYADTVGYHGDQLYNVWPYRDYVIRSFNDGKPFDQFTRENIAGDLLPDATLDQKVASGYNRLHRMTGEGGAQDKEYRAKYDADRVRTTGSVWLGSTFGCAECHDHKFDPFTAKDFYSFAAFWSDLEEKGFYPGGNWEPKIPVPSQEQDRALDAANARVQRLQTILETPTDALAAAQASWERKLGLEPEFSMSDWHGVGPFAGGTFDKAYATEFGPEKDAGLSVRYPFGGDDIGWTARPEWSDGVVHSLSGDHSATYLRRTIHSKSGQVIGLSLGSDDAIRVWLNGKEVLARKVNRGVAPDQENIQINLEPGENLLLMKIVNGTGGYGFYFKPKRAVPEKILDLVRRSSDERTPEQREEIAEYFRSIAPGLAQTRADLAAAIQDRDAIANTIPTMLVSRSMESPRTLRVLPRGNWLDDSGPIVEPAVPEFLAFEQSSDGGATRLDLADWLVSGQNPLTARVFVNRLWKLFFGAGLSKGLDDVGSQGEWPTHPALLDWLAVEFMESGWDVKHIVKLMVMSRTYRQSSESTAEMRRADPFNRYFARQARFRLDAEMIRDNALAVSGLLVREIGGPSAKPYQPPGYYSQLNFPKREYAPDSGAGQYRRGVYTHWQRTFLHPALMAFDAPNREECTADRARSNTPLQALVLLNDPSYVEAARVFAEKILLEGGDSVEEGIQWAFRRALSRPAAESEVGPLLALHEAHLAEFTADAEAARQLIGMGSRPAPPGLDPARLAAWTSIARVLFNLNEMIVRF